MLRMFFFRTRYSSRSGHCCQFCSHIDCADLRYRNHVILQDIINRLYYELSANTRASCVVTGRGQRAVVDLSAEF